MKKMGEKKLLPDEKHWCLFNYYKNLLRILKQTNFCFFINYSHHVTPKKKKKEKNRSTWTNTCQTNVINASCQTHWLRVFRPK